LPERGIFERQSPGVPRAAQAISLSKKRLTAWPYAVPHKRAYCRATHMPPVQHHRREKSRLALSEAEIRNGPDTIFNVHWDDPSERLGKAQRTTL
jgi:hypothetical protein